MSKTIDYYNNNADEFFESTVNADMCDQYSLFEKCLPDHARVLDCGCGSGRDTKYFLKRGYAVEAFDASQELCKKASKLTGIDVQNMLFQDMQYESEFDGVWACSSLLHVPADELVDTFEKIARALKPGGIFYASFKYGEYSGERNGRYFTDLNEHGVEQLIHNIPELTIRETAISTDVRPGRDEKWLNLILVKA